MAFKVLSVEQPMAAVAAEESYPEAIVRHGARALARAGEAVVGLPGDIVGGVLGLGSYATGGKIPTYEQVQEKLPISLPTSEQIHEKVTKPLTGEYLEPQGGYEKAADTLVGDFATLLIPVKGKVPFARALKTAGIGNLAGWLAGGVGLEEGGQAGVKTGAMLMANLGGPRALKDYAKTLPKAQQKEVLKAVEQTSKIHEVLGKAIDFKKLNPLSAVVLGVGYHNPKLIAASYGAGIAEKGIRMLSESPQVRKYYSNALVAATKENLPLAIKNINKMDAIINQKFSSEKSEAQPAGKFKVLQV